MLKEPIRAYDNVGVIFLLSGKRINEKALLIVNEPMIALLVHIILLLIKNI